jgi:hypothetical protein
MFPVNHVQASDGQGLRSLHATWQLLLPPGCEWALFGDVERAVHESATGGDITVIERFRRVVKAPGGPGEVREACDSHSQ